MDIRIIQCWIGGTNMAHYKCKECAGDMTKGEMVDYGTLCTDCFHDYKEDAPILKEAEKIVEDKLRLDK